MKQYQYTGQTKKELNTGEGVKRGEEKVNCAEVKDDIRKILITKLLQSILTSLLSTYRNKIMRSTTNWLVRPICSCLYISLHIDFHTSNCSYWRHLMIAILLSDSKISETMILCPSPHVQKSMEVWTNKLRLWQKLHFEQNQKLNFADLLWRQSSTLKFLKF